MKYLMQTMSAKCRHIVLPSAKFRPFKLKTGRPVTRTLGNVHTDLFFGTFSILRLRACAGGIDWHPHRQTVMDGRTDEQDVSCDLSKYSSIL